MITITSLSKVNPNDYDEVWAIVRSFKKIKNDYNGKIKHVPELSPSWELFKTYLSLKQNGKWNKDTFDKVYAPKFIKEFAVSEEATKTISRLCNLDSDGKKIALVCFCKDPELCHRSLVGGVLTNILDRDVDLS